MPPGVRATNTSVRREEREIEKRRGKRNEREREITHRTVNVFCRMFCKHM